MSLSRLHPRFAFALLLGLVLSQTAFAADGGVDRRKLYTTNIKGCVCIMTSGGPASGWILPGRRIRSLLTYLSMCYPTGAKPKGDA